MVKGGFLRDLNRNKLLGNVAFVLHRITGLALVLYLFMHLYTLWALREGSEAFNKSMKAYSGTIGHIIEYLLLVCVLVHMVNGLRLLAVELLGASRRQKQLLWWGLFLVLLISAIAIRFFFF